MKDGKSSYCLTSPVSVFHCWYKMKKIVAIHQPNFFPWMGYFDKIARSDVFVILDDVQYPKKGGSWLNRVKLLLANEAVWTTAVINRQYHGTLNINEVSFLDRNPWRKKTLRSIETSYAKHPFFKETMEVIRPLLLNETNNLSDYNIFAIQTICRKLKIPVDKLVKSSDLPHIGSANELLCSLTKSVDGSVYMCGGGAEGYQDDSIFEAQGIDVLYQEFTPPKYPQQKQDCFVAGLSIIDAAMNMGWQELANYFVSSND